MTEWDDISPIVLSSDEEPPSNNNSKNAFSSTSKRRSIYPPVSLSSLAESSTSSKPDASTSKHARKQPAKASVKVDDNEVELVEDFDFGEFDQPDGDFLADQVSRQESYGKIAHINKEIQQVDEQIKSLQALSQDLKRQRGELQKLAEGQSSKPKAQALFASTSSLGGRDYGKGPFKWTAALKKSMKTVFGIDQFRLCQEGVCNANMDGRDLICIMPTGGGKSLTYQLPAIISRGTTVVISPLLSLMADQIMHLTEQGISAAMLTGSTSKSDQRDIFDRLAYGGGSDNQKGKGKNIKNAREDEEEMLAIKLLYVTPEKVAKSKILSSTFQKMHTAGTLTRFVLDEAHCVSQLGHDYRPDYGKLSILRTLFPGVPIMAVTATCSRKVLPDLLQILNMKAITPSSSANTSGTVFFDAPLYRKNLHYKVMSKPSNAKDALVAIADYIVMNHVDESGIVYCLSKKDTEVVAAALIEHSQGAIKAGIYHADVPDQDKQELHELWREGEVNVVVATIAFGLGIDKGNVRFVIHHTLSKSLDGYYQETGRAGRDGKDASCVLYYRGQDVGRMSALVCGEREAQGKLYDMVSFAQDLQTCRKTLFGRYFSTSASLPSKAWSEKEEACGHCDNCTRDPETISVRVVTEEAWKLCRIATSVYQSEGRVTVAKLADLGRGLGGGNFTSVVTGQGKKRRKAPATENVGLDLEEVCGGKLTISKDETEHLITHLLLKGYLEESFKQTAYTVNVYIIPGPQSLRLTRQLSISNDDQSFPNHISCTFAIKAKVSRKAPNRAAAKTPKAKGKGKAVVSDGSGMEDDKGEPDEVYVVDSEEDVGKEEREEDEEEEDEETPSKKKKKPAPPSKNGKLKPRKQQLPSSDDEDEDAWEQVRQAEKDGIWDKSFGV